MVLGNTYSDEKSRQTFGKSLPTCKNDAMAVADILRRCYFEVTLGIDKCQEDMKNLFDEFIDKLDTDSVAVFYFSGMGCEYQGRQFYYPCQWQGGLPNDIVNTAFNCHSARIELNNKITMGLKIILSDCGREELSENGKYDTLKYTADDKRPLRNLYHMSACSSGQNASAPSNPGAMSHFTNALVDSLEDTNSAHNIYSLYEAIVGKLRTKDMTISAVHWDLQLGNNFIFNQNKDAYPVKNKKKKDINDG